MAEHGQHAKGQAMVPLNGHKIMQRIPDKVGKQPF